MNVTLLNEDVIKKYLIKMPCFRGNLSKLTSASIRDPSTVVVTLATIFSEIVRAVCSLSGSAFKIGFFA